MEQELQTLKEKFDAITVVDKENKIEFWYARDLQKELGYARWENFQIAIKRAMESCDASGNKVLNHFRGITKMVSIGSKAKKGEKHANRTHTLKHHHLHLNHQHTNPHQTA